MGGRPPAWESGKAAPWPSQQQLREQRAAAQRGEEAGTDSDTVPAADPSDPRGDEPPAQPRSRKRRKRR
jgi:hypothetical protein